ncbi:hypothetical protein OLMES_3356 [Oleiphilus messinensis]|uniref:Uncharacterized protein n=1 Tax=Oleiphilus messinensis TaxID=141451 RepID=A0A1Y0ID45_9GAMM|nr:hypothetical protein [Oleiphilus messinensis]ARU57395.1 hypothetical protein OLMES_3356 [Oleiphilus messinensis]
MQILSDWVFNWLRGRKRRKDLKMKSRHLLAKLNEVDPQTRAMILAMAAIFRKRVIDKSAQLSKALNHPDKMSKERLGLIFELLQAIQNKMIQEKSALDAKLDELNIHDQAKVTHWEKSVLGMDLWLITIGSAYHPPMQRKASSIWQLLDNASEHIESAIQSLRALESTVDQLDPGKHKMYGAIDDAQWRALCDFRPAFFND